MGRIQKIYIHKLIVLLTCLVAIAAIGSFVNFHKQFLPEARLSMLQIFYFWITDWDVLLRVLLVGVIGTVLGGVLTFIVFWAGLKKGIKRKII